MNNVIKGIILSAALALSAGAASATTVSGTIEEGGPSGDYNGLAHDHKFGDFSNGTSLPKLTAGGDFTIWGSVTHRNTNQNKYKDGWTMDFGTGYDLAFAWQNVLNTPLRFLIRMDSLGGTATNAPGYFADRSSGALGTGSLDIGGFMGTVSGLWAISIDPIWGDEKPTETMNWQFSGTVAAVPLPASGLLLLAGFGGLAAMRRKRKAA